MKKTNFPATAVAIAITGLLSVSAASAQSTVTLYGLVDAGVNHVTGLRNGSNTAIASGIMEGTRWGLRGSEDIGNGYKGIFTFESRVEVDTGSVSNRPASGNQLPDRFSSAVALGLPAALQPVITGVGGNLGGTVGVNLAGNLFDRQAFGGLITPFGAFTLGRQYTPAYLLSAAFDASQTQSSLAVGQVASFPQGIEIRSSNTLQYGIRTGGITATLMYGAGETGSSSVNNRFYGAMAMYKATGFSAGYGYNQRNNELGKRSLHNHVFGATFDVGPGTVYGQYATIKNNNPSNFSTIGTTVAGLLSGGQTPTAVQIGTGALVQNAYFNSFKQDARLMHIGYRMTTGPNTIVVAYNRLDDKRPANADTDSYGITYTYALSKRTNLNAVLTRFVNKGQGQAAPGGAGFLGGVTSAAGVDSTNLAFGVRHSF